MKRVIFIFLFFPAFLFVQAQQSGQVITREAQVATTGGQSRMVIDSVYSNILGQKRAYTILLPRNYEVNTSKKYPIVYLLHGIMDTNEGWYRNGRAKDVMDQLVENGEVKEMILVTPNAGGDIYAGVWNGYFNMPGWRFEDFFYQELVPHIESKYRVIGNKANRAIGGLSMGGGGSTVYAQRHPDMFTACYAMSALMTVPTNGGLPSNGQVKMDIFNKSAREHSAIDFVNNADEQKRNELRTISWFVDCGDDDILFDVNIEFYQAMRRAGIPCQLRIHDGIHKWQYWHLALFRALPFFSRSVSGCE